tara:strand:+ start:497 stop:691 length:195 start_codon:yes stop_codon:yes gene_type:complete
MSKKEKLKIAIKSAVVDSFERMKTLNHEDRFHVMLEIGEWYYNDLDEEIEDILMVPNFEKEVEK